MKKRRVLSLVTAAFMLISALSVLGLVFAFAAETEIHTAEDFKTMTDGKYKLMADLDLSEADFTTIPSFTGTLDGNGKTVSGITKPLFGTLAGTVKNLTLEGNITATGDTAALVCQAGGDLTVEGVINKVTINASSGYAGGILARLGNEYDVVIRHTKNMADITGGSVVGGLVGGVLNSSTKNYATLTLDSVENHGKITSTVAESNVGTGGIVGYTGKYGSVSITKALNYGDIALAGGDAGAGGIFGGTSWSTDRYEKVSVSYSANFGDVYVAGAGQRGRTAGIVARVNKNGTEVIIDHCYNFGAISAMESTSDGASGIFGYSGSGSIRGSVTNCYNIGTVNAKGKCAAIGMSGDANLTGANNYYIIPSESQLAGSAALIGGDRMGAFSVSDVAELLEKLSEGYCIEDGKNNGFPILKWQCSHSKTTTSLTAEYCEFCNEKLRDIEDTSTPFHEATVTKTAESTYTVASDGVSGFVSYRSGRVGGTRDIRFVLAMDQNTASSYTDVSVEVTFYQNEQLKSTHTFSLEELTRYRTVTADGNTYLAAEGDMLYGIVLTGISNSDWDIAALSLSVTKDTVISGYTVNPSRAEASETADTVGVMTFNLRYNTTSHECMALSVRGPHLMEIIDKYEPDSVGFNEATNNWMNWLRGNMANRGYAYVGVGRDTGTDKSTSTGDTNEYSPIFYKADKYELLESKTFWLSQTPETPKTKGWGSEYNRICTYAVLKNKETGEIYAHFSTHLDHKDMEAQENSVAVIETYVRSVIKTYGDIGIVVSGDFNTVEFEPNNPDYDAFTYNATRAFLDDTRYLATELGVVGKTFMGYDPEKWEAGYETDKDKPNIDTSAAPIDFIFVKKGAYTCSYYTVVNDTFTFELNGKTWHEHPVSDHYGVYAEVTHNSPSDAFYKDESKLIDYKATLSDKKPAEFSKTVTEGVAISSTFGAVDTAHAIGNLFKTDDSTAKISVSGLSHGYWEILLTGYSPIDVSGLSFTTASGIHPHSLKVFVSSDGTSWKQVGASYTEALSDNTTYYIKPEQSIEATYVKLAFTDTPDGAELSNITLYGTMKDNGRVYPEKITVTAGPSFNGKEGCDKLFDGTTATKFYFRQYSDNAVPQNPDPIDAIFFTTDTACTVTHYTLINANDTAKFKGRLPRKWTLYGSTDGENYTVIDTEENPSLSSENYAVSSFTVDTPGAYRYYKLEFVVGTTGNVQFSEMELFEDVK
ncbi:MAG: hypothetical protein IKC63_07255 [Clostridia bacterium]|nr:hypothetical protein [Clostridia bacterium]